MGRTPRSPEGFRHKIGRDDRIVPQHAQKAYQLSWFGTLSRSPSEPPSWVLRRYKALERHLRKPERFLQMPLSHAGKKPPCPLQFDDRGPMELIGDFGVENDSPHTAHIPCSTPTTTSSPLTSHSTGPTRRSTSPPQRGQIDGMLTIHTPIPYWKGRPPQGSGFDEKLHIELAIDLLIAIAATIDIQVALPHGREEGFHISPRPAIRRIRSPFSANTRDSSTSRSFRKETLPEDTSDLTRPRSYSGKILFGVIVASCYLNRNMRSKMSARAAPSLEAAVLA